MQVYIDGSAVRLNKRDYVGQGGEGAVYAHGDKAIKLYADPRKMIPVAKIVELAEIADNRVVRPLDVVADGHGAPVGYTMAYVRDAIALCQTFPRAFREREGLDWKAVDHLVRELQQGVAGVHAAGVLIVDLNEMNFLVTPGFGEVRFIDADSYQTASFPATALMESVRDRHMANPRAFTELTDWFAFAVVSFQMWCGLHPYKGKHPKLKGFDARMLANVSVFDPSVRVPKAAYPVTVIPETWRAWYRAVFEDGARAAPPTEGGIVIAVVPDARVISGTDTLDITELESFRGDVRGVWSVAQDMAVATDAGVQFNGNVVPRTDKTTAVAFSPRRRIPVAVSRSGRGLRLYDCSNRREVPFMFEPSEIAAHDGRVYMRGHDRVFELVLADMGAQVVASSKLACTVLPNATKLFPGVVFQDLLGSAHVSMFPASGTTMQAMVPELNAYKVLEARYDRGVLMVVGAKGGRYDRLVFRFDDQHRTYDVRVVEDITPAGLNFVVLDSGVVVCLGEDERLEVFHRAQGKAKINYVEDPVLGGDMMLVRRSGQLAFYRGDRLYRLRMKK
jgi:hypothetical protein